MNNAALVARQPIFDAKLNVVAYELLFRSDRINNVYQGIDGDIATSNVVSDSFLHIGIDSLTSGKKAFINFTANTLRDGIPFMVPKTLLAVEILETVIPDETVIRACRKLKNEGYLLVLDDFVFAEQYMPLVQLADIIKVDFRATSHMERLRLVQRFPQYEIKFLAEKVETKEEFESAVEMGYSFFQGYFFSKPVIISRKSIPCCKMNCLQVLKEINSPSLEFRHVEEVIKRDLSLSYRLLKFINSSGFGFRSRINSIRQALTLLGQKELIKWASLIALKEIASDKPKELIISSLIRAKFGEVLASQVLEKEQVANAFLMGLFSYLHVLLDRPLKEILDEMLLAEDVKHALVGNEESPLFLLYQIIQTYERGEWESFFDHAKMMNISEQSVASAYIGALEWSHSLVTMAEQ